jgi:hypothetical protein
VKTPAKLCFLLGLPRSGTTLLAHLLQLHPDLLAPPEPWLMLALEAFGRVDRDHPADALLVEEATDVFLNYLDRREIVRVLADTVYERYLSKAEKRCFIDKTPRYWMSLDFIDQLYPEAPQIILLRNPYAIAASLKSTWRVSLDWDYCPPRHAAHFADRTLGTHALTARVGRPQTHVVRYEELVASPLAQTRQLISALGYDPDKLATTTSDNFEYRRHSHFGDANIIGRPAPDTASIDLWKTTLTRKEMQTVTDMIGPKTINELGYSRELNYAKSVGVVENEEAVNRYKQILTLWLRGRRRDNSQISFGEAKRREKWAIWRQLRRLG